MAKTGRPRLTAEEHLRRGTYKRYRHADVETTRKPRPQNRLAWLAGLPPEAQRQGRSMLEHSDVLDREKFRTYLLAFAALAAIPRGRLETMDALGQAIALTTRLLHESPSWWRRK